MKANYPSPFEQMVVAMQRRLRPTKAQLFADRLRNYVGLNYAKVDESRLLKVLLQELSPSLAT
jgi:hypothetical protein